MSTQVSFTASMLPEGASFDTYEDRTVWVVYNDGRSRETLRDFACRIADDGAVPEVPDRAKSRVRVVEPRLTIGIDDARAHWHACLYVGETCASCSGWENTPEAAMVMLMSKLRSLHRDLGNRQGRSITEAERDLYVWLCGILG